MKTVIVSFGHSDVTLPLLKYYNKNYHNILDLIFCFSLNKKRESLLDFENTEINTGFLSNELVKSIIGTEISGYLGGISRIKFYIFKNLKLRSFRNILLAINLSRLLKKYDIIHFNGSNSVLPVLIFILRNKKLVFTIHDLVTHSGEDEKRNIMSHVSDYIIYSKFPVILQNKSDFNYVYNKYPLKKNKFYFIPFGVLDIYRLYDDGNDSTCKSDILFFGRISPYKGLEYLLDALFELKRKKNKIKTIIAGSGALYFDPNKINDPDITFINRYITNKELVNLIKGTKIVVCPYTDATQSGVIMTAYAFNKPVIATKVGGFPESIIDEETGLLCEPKNALELNDAITKLLNEPGKSVNYELNINRFENESIFAWDKITESYNNLYKNYFENNYI